MAMRTLGDLSPDEFENLAFDLIQQKGFSNVVWRTPGADGGRDIEAIYGARDASGEELRQKWYIECKRYASSVNWPTVFEKVAYAANANAEFLLMMSTANPSPNCENEITKWNSNNNLKIRFWRGYQIEGILRNSIDIGIRYGLIDHPYKAAIGLQKLALLALSLSQAAHAAATSGLDSGTAREAASAVAELVHLRTADIDQYGHAVFSTGQTENGPDWLNGSQLTQTFDEVGCRAFLAFLRHATAAQSIQLFDVADGIECRALNPRLALGRTAIRDLANIALWANLEQQAISDTSVRVTPRSNNVGQCIA